MKLTRTHYLVGAAIAGLGIVLYGANQGWFTSSRYAALAAKAERRKDIFSPTEIALFKRANDMLKNKTFVWDDSITEAENLKKAGFTPAEIDIFQKAADRIFFSDFSISITTWQNRILTNLDKIRTRGEYIYLYGDTLLIRSSGKSILDLCPYIKSLVITSSRSRNRNSEIMHSFDQIIQHAKTVDSISKLPELFNRARQIIELAIASKRILTGNSRA